MARFNLREAIAQAEAAKRAAAAKASAEAAAAALAAQQRAAAAYKPPPEVTRAIIDSVTSSGTATPATIQAIQAWTAPLGTQPTDTYNPATPVPPGMITITPHIPSEPPPTTISPAPGEPVYVPGPPLPRTLGGDGVPLPGSNIANDAWDYLRGVWGNEVGTKVQAVFEEMAASPVDLQLATAVPEVTGGVAFGIDALPAVGFAVAALLAEYINGWILRKVAALFPNPSVFGFHPLGFVTDGLDALAGTIESNAESQLHIIQSVLVTPTRMIVGLFQRLGNFGRATHNNLAHTVTNTIPLSVNDGVHRAEAYVTHQLDNIKTQLAGAVDRLSTFPSEAQAKLYISDAHRYGGIGWDVTAAAAGAIVAADEVANSLARNLQVNINASAAKVAADAQSALDAVHHDLVTMLNIDSNELTALSTTVSTTLPAQIAAEVAKAQAQDQARLTSTTLKLQGEIDAINQEIATLTQRITTDEATVARATAEITTLQGQQVVDTTAIDAQRQLIATAQSDILSNITTIKDLNTKITGISSTLAPIQAAQNLNTTQLSPFEGIGSIALPTVLATLSSTLSKLKTKVDTCTVDTCDPSSPNNIKNVLKDLLGLMTAAGEIGFIAQAIHDPQGTADALSPFLGGIDSGAVDTLNALLSL